MSAQPTRCPFCNRERPAHKAILASDVRVCGECWGWAYKNPKVATALGYAVIAGHPFALGRIRRPPWAEDAAAHV